MFMPFAVALLIAPPLTNVVTTQVCPVISHAPEPRPLAYQIAIALNQLLNTLTLGSPDETLSSRWARARVRRKQRKAGTLPRAGKWTRSGEALASGACWLLDRLQPCHCATAIERGPDGAPLAHQLHQ